MADDNNSAYIRKRRLRVEKKGSEGVTQAWSYSQDGL